VTREPGRNDPCPCGSGKKSKQCCGRPEAPTSPSADSHEDAFERAAAWLAQYRDPKGLLSNADRSKAPATVGSGLPQGLAPGALADAIAHVVRRSHAHWADEPIPALDGQTPRQAIGSAAALERVKGLLRSYQDGEVQVAAQQGRAEISYRFLWDELGIQR
jgi:hypothetical protein